MPDRKPRQETELHRLLGERIGSGDDRLARDHRCDRRHQDQRQQRPVRSEQEERVRRRLRVGQHQAALPEVVQRERREHHGGPGQPDRPAAEMPHVGVERLGSGHRQEHRSHHPQRAKAVLDEELDGHRRVDRPEDHRPVKGVKQSQRRQDDEPHQRYRAEVRRHPLRATALDPEKREQDPQRDRQDVGVKDWSHQLEALDRRQDRDRRGDRSVAVEERGAGDPQPKQQGGPSPDRALGQGQQRKRATLAAVVGAEHQHDVLEGDDQDQGPEQQRDDPDHLALAEDAVTRCLVERLAQGVERARADVAVDDTHRAQGKLPKMGWGWPRERRLRDRSQRPSLLVPVAGAQRYIRQRAKPTYRQPKRCMGHARRLQPVHDRQTGLRAARAVPVSGARLGQRRCKSTPSPS